MCWSSRLPPSPIATVRRSLQQIRDNKAYELPVKLGVITRDYVQVLDGLADGDIVATEGGYGLPEACPVEIR